MEQNVKKHFNSTHNNSSSMTKLHQCHICEKDFQTQRKLTSHIKTFHRGQKSHKCNACCKSFSQVYNLKKHIRTVQEGHKDYECEPCGKSFSQASLLKRHINTVHEGHKDYNCKSFSEAGKLKKTIYTEFMKAIKIIDVTLVVNLFLKQDI